MCNEVVEVMQLYNGDCLEIMKEIADNSVDAIITDLPYGTTKCAWDIVIPFDKMWEQYLRVAKDNAPIILFGQEPFSSLLRISNLDMFKYDIYWEKERLTNVTQVKNRPGKTIEVISVFYKGQPTYNPQMVEHTGKPVTNKVKSGVLGKLSDSSEHKVREYNDTGLRYPTQVWRYKRDILSSNLHETQKPLELMEALVRTYTNEGDTVLDSCMGSGTTGVACKKNNRNFIGIELNKGYYDIAEKRIVDTVENINLDFSSII